MNPYEIPSIIYNKIYEQINVLGIRHPSIDIYQNGTTYSIRVEVSVTLYDTENREQRLVVERVLTGFDYGNTNITNATLYEFVNEIVVHFQSNMANRNLSVRMNYDFNRVPWSIENIYSSSNNIVRYPSYRSSPTKKIVDKKKTYCF